MNDRVLQAVIRLRDEISRPLRTIRGNLEQLDRTVRESNRRTESLRNGLTSLGKTSAVVGGAMVASLGTAFIYSTKKAIEFESAFAGVKKTLNTDGMSASEVKTTLDGISTGLMNMSNHMPQSASELASIAEAGGQLGIAKENILSFTETMAMLADTTNLTSEEASTSFAQIANVTRMPQSEFKKLGSTIVALGNNGASTEADIVGLMNRVASGGKQVGMSVPQIASWSSAMASLGITAEAGGTSFNKTLGTMQIAVETNSSKLNKFAKVAGMSSSQFKKAFKDDASKALLEFTKGLGDTERNGKSTVAVLKDLGINSSEQILMLSKLAGGTKTVSDSLAVGSKAWKENNALQNEAKQRYGTTESSIKMMRNQIDNASITIGTAFLPAIRDASQFIAGIADKFNKLDPNVRKTIVTIGLVTLGIGAFLLVGGGLLIFIASMISAFSVVLPVLISIGGAFVALWEGITFIVSVVGIAIECFTAFGGVASIVGGIIAFLCSPIGMVIGAFVAIVGIVLLVKKAWETNFLGIRDITANVMNWVKEHVWGARTVLDGLGKLVKDIGTWWSDMAKKINDNPIVANVKKVFTNDTTSSTNKVTASKKKTSTAKPKTRKAFGGTITKNDTLARLHQGEKVLTKGEANRMKDSQGQGIVINVKGMTIREEADIKRVAKEFVRELKNQQVTFAGGY